MNKKITLNIPVPCSQSWNEMSRTAEGRFCTNCNTEVIDFTKMSIAQLQAYFNTPAIKVCGRINQLQLLQFNQDMVASTSAVKPFRFHIAVASLMTLLITTKTAAAQGINKIMHEYQAVSNGFFSVQKDKIEQEDVFTVRGIVMAKEDRLPIGATIRVMASNKSYTADMDGVFKFTLNAHIEQKVTLLVSYLGFESQKIDVILDQREKALAIYLVESNGLLGEVVVVATPAKRNFEMLGAMVAIPNSSLVAAPKRPSFFKRTMLYIAKWFR